MTIYLKIIYLSLESYLSKPIISEVSSNCELEQEIAIAPVEGKQTISVLNDKLSEEPAHPHLFPSSRYG